jgi:pyridoxamine 5'-phosphate oxidase
VQKKKFMDLREIRTQYKQTELRSKNLSSDPCDQFQIWLQESLRAQILEPTAMVLATCTKNGKLSTRTVLLKHVDAEGFIFFTNYDSRKAHEIEENPRVSATFLWKELERQVIIQGNTIKTSRNTSEEYFSKRPRQSQLSAAASQQGKVVSSRQVLEDEYERLDKLYKEAKIPCPENWGGFLIQPDYYEFWQGRPNRLHDRFRYQLIGGQWVIERLSP